MAPITTGSFPKALAVKKAKKRKHNHGTMTVHKKKAKKTR